MLVSNPITAVRQRAVGQAMLYRKNALATILSDESEFSTTSFCNLGLVAVLNHWRLRGIKGPIVRATANCNGLEPFRVAFDGKLTLLSPSWATNQQNDVLRLGALEASIS